MPGSGGGSSRAGSVLAGACRTGAVRGSRSSVARQPMGATGIAAGSAASGGGILGRSRGAAAAPGAAAAASQAAAGAGMKQRSGGMIAAAAGQQQRQQPPEQGPLGKQLSAHRWQQHQQHAAAATVPVATRRSPSLGGESSCGDADTVSLASSHSGSQLPLPGPARPSQQALEQQAPSSVAEQHALHRRGREKGTGRPASAAGSSRSRRSSGSGSGGL